MTQQAIAQPERLLRMPEVEQLCGLKRSSIYRQIDAGSFPQQVRLGARAVGFPASQVQKWISDRISGGQRKAQ
jgi:prophage regulatory protein